MAQLVVSDVAAADLSEILTHLEAQAGLAVASRYQQDFTRLYEQLARFPGSGSLRPRLGANIRIWTVSPYVVIYRLDVTEDRVTIARILHGRRNITAKLVR